MASPQVENGYTRIANELLEAIYNSKFNGTQLKIILCIIRYTYGFSRKSHDLSITFISKATGVSRRYISAELIKLIDTGVVIVKQEHTEKSSRVLSLNKNYKQWQGYGTNVPQAKNTSTDEELFNTPMEEPFNTPMEELFHQEKKVFKENFKESTSTTKDPVLEFMNEIGIYYTNLTGRFPSAKCEVAITEIAELTQDVQTVKKIMQEIFDRYKPVRKGDKIKTFTYFVPGIKDKLYVEQKQKGVKPRDERAANENDPYAGIGLSF